MSSNARKRRRKRTRLSIRELELVAYSEKVCGIKFHFSAATLRDFLDDAVFHIHQLQKQVAAANAKEKP